jgi:hypothetical protein
MKGEREMGTRVAWIALVGGGLMCLASSTRCAEPTAIGDHYYRGVVAGYSSTLGRQVGGAFDGATYPNPDPASDKTVLQMNVHPLVSAFTTALHDARQPPANWTRFSPASASACRVVAERSSASLRADDGDQLWFRVRASPTRDDTPSSR